MDDQSNEVEEVNKRYYKIIEKYELNSIDQQILKMEVQYPNIKQKDIAAAVKLTPAAVSQRRKKPAYRKALAEFNRTTGEWILDLGRHMFRRLRTLINDKDKDVALQAIKITAQLIMQQEQSQSVGAVIREERITFRTTVQADGSLLQEAIKEEMANVHGLPSNEQPKPAVVDLV